MKQFYVYIHKKPDGTPFYVGKGHGNRAYQFHNRNPHHQAILNKYAGQVIVEITNCLDEKSAFDLEMVYIKQIKEAGYRLANMTDGGEGPTGYRFDDETKIKMSNAKVGKKLSAEHAAKISAGNTGKKMSKECCEKRSAAFKGRLVSEETRKKLSSSQAGKIHAQETKEKMSLSRSGKSHKDSSAIYPGVIWCNTKQSWEVRAMKNGEIKRKRIKNLLDAVAFRASLQIKFDDV